MENKNVKKGFQERKEREVKLILFCLPVTTWLVDECGVCWGPWENLILSEPQVDFLLKKVLSHLLNCFLERGEKEKNGQTLFADSTASDP